MIESSNTTEIAKMTDSLAHLHKKKTACLDDEQTLSTEEDISQESASSSCCYEPHQDHSIRPLHEEEILLVMSDGDDCITQRMDASGINCMAERIENELISLLDSTIQKLLLEEDLPHVVHTTRKNNTEREGSRILKHGTRKRQTPKKNVYDNSETFKRLYNTGTISSQSSKRVTSYDTPKRKSRQILQVAERTPPRRTPPPSTKKKANRHVYSPRLKPQTILTFKSRYHPGLGIEKIDPVKLGLAFFQKFNQYENGDDVDSEQLVREIIVALVKKDYPKLGDWNFESSVSQKAENLYHVCLTVTYCDWKSDRVASAQAVVQFLSPKKEVRVEKYTVTGDLP